MQPSTTTVPIFRILESTAGIASLLVAAGYLSLRAHLNHLGISALEEVGIERILSETASLAQALLVSGLLAGLLIGAGLLASLVMIRALGSTFARLQPHRSRLVLTTRRVRWPSVVALLCTTYLLWHVYLILTLAEVSSVAVGPLDSAKLMPVPLWIWLAQVVALLIAVYIGLRLIGTRTSGWQRWLSVSMGIYLLTSSFFTTPLVFGIAARSTEYSIAIVSVTEQEVPQCGLLVMITAEQLALWRAEDQVGRTLYLPRSRVRGFVAGTPMNILELGRQALLDTSGYPSEAMCKELSPTALIGPSVPSDPTVQGQHPVKALNLPDKFTAFDRKRQ